MELHWTTSQVEEPGKVGEDRFGKEDNSSVGHAKVCSSGKTYICKCASGIQKIPGPDK